MQVNNAEHTAAALFFSTTAHHREFAFTLYDELPFESFPEGLLSARTDEEIALCIFESRRHYVQADNLVRLLVSLRERAESGEAPLAKLFGEELLYQAKNYPGAVLGGLQSILDKSPLVRDVVSAAETYFDKLRGSYKSAINSMEIPGWRRAMAMHSRKQSRQIESHQTEFSVFSQLFATSYLIYGSEGFRYCQNGEIGEMSPMKAMSVSMEMPRLSMIDPEGVLVRSIESGRSTDALSTVIEKKKTAAQ
jgi:hypothetical protein